MLTVLEVEPSEVPLTAERFCKERCNGYRVPLGDFIWVSPSRIQVKMGLLLSLPRLEMIFEA